MCDEGVVSHIISYCIIVLSDQSSRKMVLGADPPPPYGAVQGQRVQGLLGDGGGGDQGQGNGGGVGQDGGLRRRVVPCPNRCTCGRRCSGLVAPPQGLAGVGGPPQLRGQWVYRVGCRGRGRATRPRPNYSLVIDPPGPGRAQGHQDPAQGQQDPAQGQQDNAQGQQGNAQGQQDQAQGQLDSFLDCRLQLALTHRLILFNV